MFSHLPVRDRPLAARKAGFKFVESWWPDEDAELLRDEIETHSLELILVNAWCGDIHAGDRGFANDVSRHGDVLASIAEADALHPRFINVLVGVGNGRAHVVDVLKRAAELPLEAIIVIEHLNTHDVPGFLLPTPQAAAELVAEVNSPRVRLLYDAYHAAVEGLDPARDVLDFGGLVGHVHYAETPGRRPPTARLWRFVESLEKMHFGGWVGLEHLPGTSFSHPPIKPASRPSLPEVA